MEGTAYSVSLPRTASEQCRSRDGGVGGFHGDGGHLIQTLAIPGGHSGYMEQGHDDSQAYQFLVDDGFRRNKKEDTT